MPRNLAPTLSKHLLLGLVAAIALMGCAASIVFGESANRELAATLIFEAGDRPLDEGSGFYSVGEHYMAGVKRMHIAPGKRRIGYNCPGWIFVDASPSVEHTFQGGHTYFVSCHDGVPRFRRDSSKIGAAQIDPP